MSVFLRKWLLVGWVGREDEWMGRRGEAKECTVVVVAAVVRSGRSTNVKVDLGVGLGWFRLA